MNLVVIIISVVVISNADRQLKVNTITAHTAELKQIGVILKRGWYMRSYEENKLITDLYRSNDDFKEYVERYSHCRHISIDEALSHEIVLEKAKDVKYRLLMNKSS